jgi:hypothetical protein
MKRLAAALVACVLVAGAIAFWYFRSSRTRLTAIPGPVEGPVLRAVGKLPKTPRAVIVIVEENKGFDEVIGDEHAPYINALATEGALFTQSYAVAHPSQPNYFALFAGAINSNGDNCPAAGIPPNAPNLGAEVVAAHRAFRAYSEDLPFPGYTGCASGEYAQKHAPWTHFSNIPPQASQPFSALRSFDTLPDVGFIIPNQLDNMHSASVERGDTWLRQHAAPLVAWAKRHDALVILTWDESNNALGNHIPTIFVGPMVKPGQYDERITQYDVLRTIEDLFALPHTGHAAEAKPITDVWR